MSSARGSTPERRQPRRREQSPEPAASAAVSIALVLANRDLLAEILLRVDSPTWLVRATLASKSWLRVASGPAFVARFRALHSPLILGLSVIGVQSTPRLLPFPQPPELAAAARLAGLAIGNLGRDSRCEDYCNGCLLIEKRDDLSYVVASLLHEGEGRQRILPSPPRLGSASDGPGLVFHSRHMFFFDDDATSFLWLVMACDATSVRASFSILRSGVWGVDQSAVREIQQDPVHIVFGHKLLAGGKLYMSTSAGYILALDLATATFSAVELPDGAAAAIFATVKLPHGVEHRASLKFSRAQQSGFYLIYAMGLQLHVWHGDGAGQWVLVDTISVCKACANLNVQTWIPDDEHTSPVWVVGVGDNAEFVILELVASGIVCCMQVSNRVVEKVADGGLQQSYGASVHPITMVWPPFLPVPPVPE
ncbi:hypothetical protein PR202_ga18163 [Eleusine coracana subsp. coracana]|uniref:F-box protein AT5G49610-like beta-propeller domain-containing protein n=1 Tax=Eleusine coracana subsp. coracana TaxID=191504 RepID=A0AAV5CSD6_ELECO|nr:hypothetical protein QOZ80_6AG0508590 [Eleusine coracana subsp. coracana]GJN00936.1 hypothetical protein PR202_ga18163 [Eleusine coracana subsp. coracana]